MQSAGCTLLTHRGLRGFGRRSSVRGLPFYRLSSGLLSSSLCPSLHLLFSLCVSAIAFGYTMMLAPAMRPSASALPTIVCDARRQLARTNTCIRWHLHVCLRRAGHFCRPIIVLPQEHRGTSRSHTPQPSLILPLFRVSRRILRRRATCEATEADPCRLSLTLSIFARRANPTAHSYRRHVAEPLVRWLVPALPKGRSELSRPSLFDVPPVHLHRLPQFWACQ